MLQDEDLSYIEEQFKEKNEVLSQFGDQVSPWTFYEDIFEDLETEVPVVIIDEEEGSEEKKIRTMTVNDAIEFASCRNDSLMGGCTYFNNWISKKSARDCYTLIIDYDNAYSGVLLQALQRDWKSANGENFAKPTYIVNSGTGLHLYFVLSEKIPVYHSMTENLDKVYRALAVQQSKRVYVNRQVQWFGQDFRIAGGLNKYGWENTIFKIGEKWDIDDLAKAVDQDLHFTRYGEKRTRKPKEKGRTKYKKRSGWKVNRAFYDYALENCRQKTHEGNRYLSMCALSAIAWKCAVPEEELRSDLIGLLPEYNKGATRIIKEKEVISAMKMYNEKAILTQRGSLENWQGWKYEPKTNRHYGRQKFPRKKTDTAREKGLHNTNIEVRGWSVRDAMYPDDEWRHVQESKQDLVTDWISSHPDGSVSQCAKDLQISRTTVYKYWKE